MSNKHKLLIIGAGSAGYTAAIYAARAGLAPILLTGMQPGGQLTITTDVENYPGFAEAVQGPWLMEQMKAQAENVGTVILNDTVQSVEKDGKDFKIIGQSETYMASSIVIATGASAKWLDVSGELDYRGFGVSACATCDGFFFKNQHVAVVGGGNTAAEEALYMTNHASKVTLIHRRDTLRAEKVLQDRIMKHPKIETLWNKQVIQMCGQDKPKALTHVKLEDTQTGAISQLDLDGLFVAIGHKPNTDIFKGFLPFDDHGYLLRHPDSSKTDVDGVFVAGDVADPIYRQAVTAAGMGCMAALDAERYLAGLEDN